jgi:hypothetical protein
MGNFYVDTISSDPRFISTERISDVAMLEPITALRVQSLIAKAASAGTVLEVFETYRSQQRQQMLFDQGATRLRNVGVHHYGLACDLVKVVNGQPSWAGDFTFLAPLCYQVGLISGNDWGFPGVKHGFVDPDHVQRVKLIDQPALFDGTWYPDDNYLGVVA